MTAEKKNSTAGLEDEDQDITQKAELVRWEGEALRPCTGCRPRYSPSPGPPWRTHRLGREAWIPGMAAIWRSHLGANKGCLWLACGGWRLGLGVSRALAPGACPPLPWSLRMGSSLPGRGVITTAS